MVAQILVPEDLVDLGQAVRLLVHKYPQPSGDK
jgi:hypothetical protein